MRKLVGVIALAIAASCGGGGGGGSGDGGSSTPPPQPPATPPPAEPPSVPAPPSSTCVPATCGSLGKNCGPVADGCGGMLFCGTCVAGQACGAGGAANVCGVPAPSCTPATCAAAGKNCGAISDGCGGTLQCGACSGDQACGSGGQANVCGTPPAQGGDTRWVTWWAGPDREGVLRIRADAAGDLYTLGSASTLDAQDLVIRKYRGDGTVAWEKRYGGGPGIWVWPNALAVAPGGSVYFTVGVGCTTAPCAVDFGGGAAASALVKLGGDGTFEWQKSDLGVVTTVAADAAGNVAVQHWDDAPSRLDVFGPRGDHRFTSSWTDPHALAYAPDGALYVAWTDYTSGYQPQLGKLDPAGAVLWTRRANYVNVLATSARGTPVGLEWDQLAVYEPNDGAERFRVSLPMYSSDLSVQPGTQDVIRAVVVGQDSGGCNALAVRTYDLAGAFRWSRLVGANGSCGGSPTASGVAVLESGDVVVGGGATVATDLGDGEHTPRGAADGFVVQLAR